MKESVFLFLLLISCMCAKAQCDTLYTKSGKKIPCKITEIGDSEIKYKMADLPEGPVYVANKSRIAKYTLSSGFTEILHADELSLEEPHQEIAGNRQVIKTAPFSFAFSHISVAYERVVKPGINIEIETGFINNTITNYDVVKGRHNRYEPYTIGTYLKPGMKFYMGEDFSMKGLKYAHPLKGRYIRLDLIGSWLYNENIKYNWYTYPQPGLTVSNEGFSNFSLIALGGFVNYGRQFIIRNLFTIDYYLGVGYTGVKRYYSNPEVASAFSHAQLFDPRSSSYHYTFLRYNDLGLSLTGGLRIGYIIPSKKIRNGRKNKQ